MNAEGDVLSLMLAPAEMNPLALELDCPEGHLNFTELIQPESEVSRERDLLCVGELTIRLDSAGTWDPFPDWGEARENHQHIQDMISDVNKILIANHSPDSLETSNSI